MTLEELRELLAIINSDEPVGIRVHVIERTEEENQQGEIEEIENIREANISQELAQELQEDFVNNINARFFNDEEFQVSNISEAHEMSNSVYYYDLDEFPQKLNVLQEFDAWTNYPDFSFNNNDIENVKALLITIGNQNSHFTIFKHVYPVTIIRQDRIIGLIPFGDRFEKLNSNILQINTSIDFLYAQESLIINSVKTLTNSYGYKEIIINQARDRVLLIGELNLISNLDVLEAFITNVKYAKRVLKINPHSPVLQLARNRIVDFILNHPKLQNKIRIDEENQQIVLDTDVSKIVTIGILNDDFLKSNLTDLDYESEKKSSLAEEEE